nr:phage major tail tube protein [Pseudomonas koreensis]
MVSPLKSVQPQCRSSVQELNNGGLVNDIPLVTTMTITVKEYQLGTHYLRDSTKYETQLSPTHVWQTINGEEVVLLDYLANILRVGGEDQRARYQKNIGQI